MPDLLFLSQRLPYPPNKGDKIRSWHFFRHLAETHRMHLGCFIDDPTDWQHLDAVRRLCASSCILPLPQRARKLISLAGLLSGEALSLPYFRHRVLQRWVADTMRRHPPDLVFVYCSAMAQYVMGLPHGDARLVVDMVDMDSQKWRQYAANKRWPANVIYRRESRLLHRFEEQATRYFDRTLFVSSAEAELYRGLTPGLGGKVDFVENGVDLEFFSPDRSWETPFPAGIRQIVFTGMMDYWPNIDAVTWFADAVWPDVRRRFPDVQFTIAGANPGPQVRRLAERGGIVVTGRVPDIRPYLAHAAVVVAPLRIAQGIQNKVLEAMSMARPVVATPQALDGIAAEAGRHLVLADDAVGLTSAVAELLTSDLGPRLGASARSLVEERYGWPQKLRRLTALCGRPRTPALA